jgi:hypothetical protein
MATLTESKELTPYLPQLVPRVREVLVDPVPEARATAARALGSLVERLGEDTFSDLVPALMATLSSDASGVDQQGAAQGLAEILSGLGIDRLEDLLPTIISSTSSPRAYVREGFISLLVFLPATFGDRFQPYLSRIIQPILSGLADDSDYVREASMRAGKMIVANHSVKAVDLLLPELERGLFDQSWRIRQSSILLVGELLFRISGISGKVEVEEDEDDDIQPVAETSKKALVDVLGRERRDRVLAGIYIVRQDAVGAVRAQATHVWKALVQNTPRTVREVLPTLSMFGFLLSEAVARFLIVSKVHILVRILASEGDEQREVSRRTWVVGYVSLTSRVCVMTDGRPYARRALPKTWREHLFRDYASSRKEYARRCTHATRGMLRHHRDFGRDDETAARGPVRTLFCVPSLSGP